MQIMDSPKTAISAGVKRNVATSLVTGTLTAISFTSTDFDTGGFWSAGAPTRLTIPAAGKYFVNVMGEFSSNAVGARLVSIYLNGTTFVAATQSPVNSAADATQIIAATILNCVAGDYLEFIARQSSGGALDITAASDYSSRMQIFQIA